MRRRRPVVGILAGLCLLAAGCADDSATGTWARLSAEQVWTRSALTPVGQPLAVGGVAVGAITEGQSLFLVGLDPATGAELWRRAASPGEVVSGVAVQAVAVGDRVAYFRPDPTGNLYARLVVADARTGTDVAVTAPLLFGSLPLPCADSTDVCTLSRATYKDGYRPHRLRVATGEFLLEDAGLPDRARTIGAAGLVDLGRRDPEIVGLVRDGTLRWQVPLQQAFPAGFSTDNGWDWRRYRAQQVYVGSVYARADGEQGGVRTRNLAASAASAGVSEKDGAVLWRDAGSDIGCGSLYVRADPSDPTGPVLPVRCRSTGTVTYPPNGAATYAGLDVTVEGFDVRTGTTTWSVPVGAAEALAGSVTLPAIAGATEVLVQTGAGPLIVDVATGAHRAPAAGTAFWCRARYRFTYREPYYVSGQPRYERNGGLRASICDAAGKPASGPPRGTATAAVGASIGSYAVVATADGFTGFKVR